MNTCTICRHEKREEIEKQLARGVALRRIASQFETSDASLRRHHACIAEALEALRNERKLKSARATDDELERCFVNVNKLFDACDDYLTDPDNPERYTLSPRTSDIDIIYEEEVGEYNDGTPIYKKKRAKLSQLLAEIDQAGRNLVGTEYKISDPRKLILEAADTLSGLIDRLAKLKGEYQEKRQNEHDKRERREVLIEALLIIYAAKGESKTRQEIVTEVDESMRAVNAVWNEAKMNAQRNGYIM